MSNIDKILINVGGEKFETTKETLLSEPGSLFDHILNGRWKNAYDSEDPIFFDRDPRFRIFSVVLSLFYSFHRLLYRYFRPILNFLRTRQVVLDGSICLKGVLHEAEFFMVLLQAIVLLLLLFSCWL